jgi:hypothetical protein
MTRDDSSRGNVADTEEAAEARSQAAQTQAPPLEMFSAHAVSNADSVLKEIND